MKLINLLTKQQHQKVLQAHTHNASAAQAYTEILGHPVSRQLVEYWRKVFEGSSKAKVNTSLADSRTIRKPSPGDDIGGDLRVPEMARRIMVIGDLHYPYAHPDTIEFLETVKRNIDPDLVVQIGDETDGHALSFHDSDPNLDSAGVELEKAKLELAKLHDLFPNMLVCHSNHGSLIYRRAKAHGLPVQYIRTYREILFPGHGAPGWSWASAWEINTPRGKVLFQHQTSGHVLDAASAEGCNLVVGHEHGKFGAEWRATSQRLFYGAYTGCLIDHKSLAFAYGKLFQKKPIIGVLVIQEGVPVCIPMELGEDGRWIGRSK